jgi:hypothetical protein
MYGCGVWKKWLRLKFVSVFKMGGLFVSEINTRNNEELKMHRVTENNLHKEDSICDVVFNVLL